MRQEGIVPDHDPGVAADDDADERAEASDLDLALRAQVEERAW